MKEKEEFATLEADRIRFKQEDKLRSLLSEQRITDLVTVYLSDTGNDDRIGMYCGLVPSKSVKKHLKKLGWIFYHGQGSPGAVKYYRGEKRTVKYLRYGSDDGIEPLIIDREFHGIRRDYTEISEEFRHFHQLFHDQRSDKYYKIKSDGTEILIATVEPNRIQIRLKEIRQFLAIKEMHLAIQFDCREFSDFTLEQLGISKGHQEFDEQLCNWGIAYGDTQGFSDHASFSRLLGKYFIEPLPKSKSGLWGFAEEESKKYVDFILGMNSDGDELIHTSDPAYLADNFGGNPSAPHYLTPIYFRKQVLDKYYQQPAKYSVEDGYLRCGSLWGTYIDNHHPDKVCVWLGDLGRDLSYEEQLYWRSYNIPPDGGPSEVFIRRQIAAQFTDSKRSEHIFHSRYQKLRDESSQTLGWYILLPLAKGDEHHLQTLRIPAGDEQREFDELILGLSKILIDSLNDKKLNASLDNAEKIGLRGSISKLEFVLIQRDARDFEPHIKFLRQLQQLRSSGSAHRKGANYEESLLALNINGSYAAALTEIFENAIKAIDYLIAAIRSGWLPPSNDIIKAK